MVVAVEHSVVAVDAGHAAVAVVAGHALVVVAEQSAVSGNDVVAAVAEQAVAVVLS